MWLNINTLTDTKFWIFSECFWYFVNKFVLLIIEELYWPIFTELKVSAFGIVIKSLTGTSFENETALSDYRQFVIKWILFHSV